MMINKCDRPLRIGVIGFSDDSKIKDREWAYATMCWIRSELEKKMQDHYGECNEYVIVSGLTDVGIPGLMYHDVTTGNRNKEKYIKTVGVACSKAKDFPQFPVDEKHIIGNEWGDESDYFLDHIDGLMRIGGGNQSIQEAKMFKERYPDKPIREFDSEYL